MENTLLIILLIVFGVFTIWWYLSFVAKGKKIIAESSAENPTIHCFAGEYQEGSLLSFKPCILKINDGKMRITTRSGEELFSTSLSELKITQGGITQPSKIMVSNKTETWWIRPFSSLFSARDWRSSLKVVLPARDAISKALTDHGARESSS